MKKLNVLLLLLAISLSAAAQLSRKGDVELKATVGQQFYAGENDWKAKIVDRVAYSYTLEADKWISDYVALGFTFNESQMQGLYNVKNGNNDHFRHEKLYGKWTKHIKDQSQFDNLYVQEGNYFDLYFHFSWDVISAYKGMKDRKFTVIPTFGLGWMHSFGRDCRNFNHFSINADVEARYRLNDKWALLFSVHNGLVPDYFDGEHSDSDRDFDGFQSLHLGVSYTFKKK